MKHVNYFLLLLPLSAHAGLVPLGVHVDVRWQFTAGEWRCELKTDNTIHSVDEAFLPLTDKPYVNGSPATSGARHTQPTALSFAFTGAQPGTPLWLAVQGTPGIGEAWPGMRNDQSEGTYGSYIPADSRVSQSTARPWIRISLVGYEPPHGKTSHFSMWNTITGQPPIVWMSTYDTSVDNSFYYAAGSHTHATWGFTAQGIHRVTLRASAFSGPGATNPTGLSEPFTLTFAVGTQARWQAETFSVAQLINPAVSSMAADADSDGYSNLLEYAFGTDALKGGAIPKAEGLGLPAFSLVNEGGTIYQTMSYPRRRAGLRLSPDLYLTEFSQSLSAWSSAGNTTQVSNFPVDLSSLNANWELVRARRVVPSGDTKGFGHVQVTSGD